MKTPPALTTLLFAFLGLTAIQAQTTGFWRFDEETAEDGAAIEAAASEANSSLLDALPNGSPSYSEDVPGTLILDPKSGQSWGNRFSMACGGANSRVQAPSDPVLDIDGDFTLEMFIKFDEEPAGWNHMFRRQASTDHRWFVTFNHGNGGGGYGKLRAVFRVLGTDANKASQGSVVFVDTEGATGDPADYVGEDVAADGDGVNDSPDWHHIATVYSKADNTVSFYTDYVLGQTQTLDAPFTHPDGPFQIGKHNGEDYLFKIDEVRYTAGALTEDQFLVATANTGDSDGDDLPDVWEQTHFEGLAQDGSGDPDGDGLDNAGEHANGLDPNSEDTDGDGLKDAREVNETLTDGANADTDGDRLTDGAEVTDHGTDPTKPDTDDDGLEDQVELVAGTDPTDAGSLPPADQVFQIATGKRWEDAGTWSDGNAPEAGKHYVVLGGVQDSLRSPSTGRVTFGGDSLTLQGDGSQLLLETESAIPSLHVEGGALVAAHASGTLKLNSGVQVTESGFVRWQNPSTTFEINGPLTGTGEITLGQTGEDSEFSENLLVFNGRDHDFQGTWSIGPGITVKVVNPGALENGDVILNNGVLDADYNLNNPSGNLILNGDESVLVLDQEHTFGGFFIGENDLLALAQGAGLVDASGVFTGEVLLALGFPEEAVIDEGGSIIVSGDSDGDTLADWWELTHFENLDGDGEADPDSDGLVNRLEILWGSDPNVADSDNDSVQDGDEVNVHGSHPLKEDSDGDGLTDPQEINGATPSHPALVDSDGDGLDDKQEIDGGTNPALADSDADGYPDAEELAFGADPADAGSIPPFVALGEPTASWFALRSLPSFHNYMGDYDQRDMTFSVSIDFLPAEGEREVIFETGGGTIGTSLVYEIGDSLVLRSVGNSGLSLATAEYTLTEEQIDAGELEVLWTYQVDNGSGEQVIALYLDKELVASQTMDIGGDWSGSDQATFGLQTGVTGNGENGTIPGTAFVSGAINLEKGLRFWGDTLFERAADTDEDGISDGYEELYFPGDLTALSADGDFDEDGLLDPQEARLRTDPTDPDTDADGVNDGAENEAGTNPLVADTDGDGLSDSEEVAAQTDPNSVDSDGDSSPDGFEVAEGTDPNDANSTPNFVLGVPTSLHRELRPLPTFDGPLNADDMSFRAFVDFNAKSDGEPEVIFETGAGTIGTSVVYESGNRLVMRSVGNDGLSLATIEHVLTTEQLAAGLLEVIWTYDVLNAEQTQTIALYLNGAQVAATSMNLGGDWTGNDAAAFGVADSGFSATGDNAALTGVDFSSGTISASRGLQFYSGRLFEGGEPPVIVDPDPVDRPGVLTINRSHDGAITLTWPTSLDQISAVEYSISMDANSWTVIADNVEANGQTATFEDTDGERTNRDSGYYRVRSSRP